MKKLVLLTIILCLSQTALSKIHKTADDTIVVVYYDDQRLIAVTHWRKDRSYVGRKVISDTDRTYDFTLPAMSPAHSREEFLRMERLYLQGQ